MDAITAVSTMPEGTDQKPMKARIASDSFLRVLVGIG
jgi:hypothetical protein